MFFINLTKHQIKRYIFRKNIGQKESFVPFFSTKLSFCLVNNLKIMDYFYDFRIRIRLLLAPLSFYNPHYRYVHIRSCRSIKFSNCLVVAEIGKYSFICLPPCNNAHVR